jgi:hypothetical protein
VNARLAEIGLAATTAVRGGGRTAMRAAQPGEACFTKNGEQLPAIQVCATAVSCRHGLWYAETQRSCNMCCTASALVIIQTAVRNSHSVHHGCTAAVHTVCTDMCLHTALPQCCQHACYQCTTPPPTQHYTTTMRVPAHCRTFNCAPACMFHLVVYRMCAGSPLSMHPNITRARGRKGAARGWALMTPAVAAAAGEAAGPGGAMLGCFTLVKKGGAATGAAAATGRAGRSRAATAAGRGAGAAAAAAQGAAAAAAGGEDTVMVITTDGGLLQLRCRVRACVVKYAKCQCSCSCNSCMCPAGRTNMWD